MPAMKYGGVAEFCDGVRDQLVRSMTLYCGDQWVAEELAQEALIRAWERWSRVSGMESPEAWTFRTATNLANSWFRRRAAERRAHSRMASAQSHDSDATSATAVRTAVAALADRQRLVVVARYFMDLSVEDTATLLECAPGTVRASTHQAIQRLRTMGLDVDDELQEVQ